DGTAAQLAYAHLDWAPLALLGGTLEIDALTARGLHLTLPPPSADEAEAPRALALPFAVRADNVALEDIRITRAGAAPFAIGAIELERTIDSERARIERLRVAAPRFDVRAHGSIGLEPDTEGTLTTDWRVEPPGQPAVAGAGEVRGNLARLVIEQRVSAPVPARVRAQVQDALGDMTWSAEASVPEFPAGALGLDDIDARAALSLSASGTRERFRAEGDVRALLPALPPIAGRFELRGESEGPIALEQLLLAPEDAPARLTARGQWQPGDGRWQAHLAWERLQWPLRGEPLLRSPEGTLEASGTRAQYRLALAARALVPQLPPLALEARGQGDRRRVTLQEVRARAEDATVGGTLRFAWAPAVEWQTRLAWENLRWPFAPDPRVRSPQGTLAASGNLERYTLEAQAATRADGLPDARWHVSGAGDRRHVALDRVRLEALDATLQGRVRAAWAPALEWEATLQGADIDPSGAWPEWPGRLALAARASGDAQVQRVHIESLKGQLRGQAIAASARATRRGE